MNWNLIQGAIVDFDGVVADTARLHEEAWRLTFVGLAPFSKDDYLEAFDGVPRKVGIARFLQRRHLQLPQGVSVESLAQSKQPHFLQLIEREGVTVRADILEWVSARLHLRRNKNARAASRPGCLT